MTGSAVPAAARVRTSTAGCTVVFLWCFAVMWYGVVGTMALVFYFKREPDQWGPLAFLGLFALAGLLILWLAIKATTSAVRFRGAELDLQTIPGVLGGKISGVVRAPQRVAKLAPLRFRLSSWRRFTDASDDLLWEDYQPVEHLMSSGGEMVTLPFSIRVPFDCEPTADSFYWRLELGSVKTKSSVDYEVPMARTAQSSEEQTRTALRRPVTQAPSGAAVKIDRQSGGIDVAFPLPSWFWKWYAFVVIVAVAAYGIAPIVLRRFRADGMPGSFEVMTYVVLSAIVLFLAGFPLISLALSVRRIHADRTGARIAYAFPLRRPVRVTREELKDVTLNYATSSMKYSIDFIRANGKPMIGSVMFADSKEEADWIGSELRRAIFGE
jgi:hypothetical protein